MFDLIPWKRKHDEAIPVTRNTEFRREFDDLVNRFFGPDPWLPTRFFSQGFTPVVDVSETDTEVVVKAELPGMDPKDLVVDLTGDVLTISGEKKEEREDKSESHYRLERSFGSFSRSLRIPCEIKDEKVEAKFKDGVLSLRLPKAQSIKKKSIEVKVGD